MFDKQNKLLLKEKLKDMKYKYLHKELFNILSSDENFKYSKNINGLYFDLNKLDGDTIDKISELFKMPEQIDDITKMEYKPYYIEKYSNSSEIEKNNIIY